MFRQFHLPTLFALFLLLFGFYLSLPPILHAQDDITITRIASGLNNPRGVAALPGGDLLVVEAGTGSDQPQAVTDATGQIMRLIDVNRDGDYDDPDERYPFITGHPSYNSLALFGTLHDEPFGLSDILVGDDGTIYFTKDDPFHRLSRNEGGDLYYGNTGIFRYPFGTGQPAEMFIKRPATLNSLAYDAQRNRFYTVESGFNRLIYAEGDNEPVILAEFPELASGQQAVPSGVAIDPTSGDILVALFSGYVHDYYETTLSFVPGDARVVRVDADSGAVHEVITGLTTAIDLAVDEAGNIFVVELTTQWPTPLMPADFDVHDPQALPDPGGYVRYSGRITLYPAQGGEPRILMQDVDTPTNITYADGVLFVSSGLGTPGRVVLTPNGLQPIVGSIYRISGF